MTPRSQHAPVSLFRPLPPMPRPCPEPTIVHMLGCDCSLCEPTRLTAAPIAAWALAGAATGSAIAFAIDPHGAWHALAGAAAHLVGIGR